MTKQSVYVVLEHHNRAMNSSYSDTQFWGVYESRDAADTKAKRVRALEKSGHVVVLEQKVQGHEVSVDDTIYNALSTVIFLLVEMQKNMNADVNTIGDEYYGTHQPAQWDE